MIIIFDKNNIPYGQDMQFFRGIPDGIEFEVKNFTKEQVILKAPGYGGKPYGNGAIFVFKKQIWESLDLEKVF